MASRSAGQNWNPGCNYLRAQDHVACDVGLSRARGTDGTILIAWGVHDQHENEPRAGHRCSHSAPTIGNARWQVGIEVNISFDP